MTSSVVSAVIDQLAGELVRSVVINDPAMQMLYASAHYGDEDPVRVKTLLNHGAEPRARGHVLGQGVSDWTRAGLIPANEDIEMHARVCVPVRFEGVLLALLMVIDADGSITTAELGRINEVARELALALHDDDRRAAAGNRDDQNHEEQTVLDLIGSDPSARRDAVAALRATGRSERFTTTTAVDIAVARSSTTTSPHVEIALRHALSTRVRGDRIDSMFAVTAESAVLLVGSAPRAVNPVDHHVEEILERVHELASGHFRCVAGIGSAGDGLDHAARSFAQAGLARRAAELGLRPAVTPWTSLGVYGPLLSIPRAQLAEASIPHELQQLRAVDADGQLAATLRAYLDAAGNGPSAANELHIHRTSLYYRLGRIRDLTGIDVADGHTRLATHLGFALLDIINAQAGTEPSSTDGVRASAKSRLVTVVT